MRVHRWATGAEAAPAGTHFLLIHAGYVSRKDQAEVEVWRKDHDGENYRVTAPVRFATPCALRLASSFVAILDDAEVAEYLIQSKGLERNHAAVALAEEALREYERDFAGPKGVTP